MFNNKVYQNRELKGGKMKKVFLALVSIMLLATIDATLISATFFENNTKNVSRDNEAIVFSLGAKHKDNELIIVIKQEYSSFDRVFNFSDFEDAGVVELEDLSMHIDNPNNYPMFNEKYYCQLLRVVIDSNRFSLEEAIEALQLREEVAEIIPNYILSNATLPSSYNISTTSNDPYKMAQYVYNKLELEKAWTYTTGSYDVKVGIIDTGILSHTDLNDNVIDGKDVYNNNYLTNDANSPHGTHVAGIVGAIGNNNIGISGINWRVSMVPIQVEQNHDVHMSSVYKGIQYAVQNNIPIINMSFGAIVLDDDIPIYPFLSTISAALAQYNGLAVCAAGNNGTDLDYDDQSYFPAEYEFDNVISVAASDSNDSICSFSNYGNNIDIFAPGEDIYSTVDNQQYANWDGTSMATPMVSGVAALLKAYDPSLTTAQIKSAILNSADQITGLASFVPSGRRLNAKKALQYVAGNGRVRNYKLAIDLGTIQYPLDYAQVKTFFSNSLMEYKNVSYGNAIPNSSDASMSVSNVGIATCTYYTETPLNYIMNSGRYCTMRFDANIGISLLPNLGIQSSYFERPNGSSVNVSTTPTKVLVGDLNFDNYIDSSDLALITGYVAGTASLTDKQLFAADSNNSGTVNSVDITRLTKYIEGTRSSLMG